MCCTAAATLLDNAKNGFVIRAADAQYAQGDTSSHIYDGRPVPDTPGNRLLGWQRICLLVCFFGPSSLYDPDASFNKYAGRPIVFPVVRYVTCVICDGSSCSGFSVYTSVWGVALFIPR